MFDFQLAHDEMLRAQAVPATVASLFSNSLSDLLGDAGYAHGAGGSRKPRRTASCRACALRSSPSWYA